MYTALVFLYYSRFVTFSSHFVTESAYFIMESRYVIPWFPLFILPFPKISHADPSVRKIWKVSTKDQTHTTPK